MDFVLTTGDLITIAAVVVTALGITYGVGRWTKKTDSELKIISGKGDSTAKMLFGLVKV